MDLTAFSRFPNKNDPGVFSGTAVNHIGRHL